MIAAHAGWIAQLASHFRGEGRLGHITIATVWPAFGMLLGPPNVSHVHLPGEYLAVPLITGLHLLALKNQQPGFIDLP